MEAKVPSNHIYMCFFNEDFASAMNLGWCFFGWTNLWPLQMLTFANLAWDLFKGIFWVCTIDKSPLNYHLGIICSRSYANPIFAWWLLLQLFFVQVETVTFRFMSFFPQPRTAKKRFCEVCSIANVPYLKCMVVLKAFLQKTYCLFWSVMTPSIYLFCGVIQLFHLLVLNDRNLQSVTITT